MFHSNLKGFTTWAIIEACRELERLLPVAVAALFFVLFCVIPITIVGTIVYAKSTHVSPVSLRDLCAGILGYSENIWQANVHKCVNSKKQQRVVPKAWGRNNTSCRR